MMLTEIEPYFAKYLKLVPSDSNIVQHIEIQGLQFFEWLKRVNDIDSLIVHPPFQWNFRQVVQHINDAERVFSFRLLWLARGEATPLESYDENRFSKLAFSDKISWPTLVNEFRCLRNSTQFLLSTLSEDAWQRSGVAAGFRVDVREQACILFGHVEHHFQILKQRLGR